MSQNKVNMTVCRARLGEPLYNITTDFILTDPNMYIMPSSYNRFHDWHSRKYFQRKDMLNSLRKERFITEDNEVLCSIKEYKSHQSYLESLKCVSDRTISEIQRGQLRKFLACQEEGRIPKDVSLAEMREILLDEEMQSLRKQLQADTARVKSKDRRRKDREEDKYYSELSLMNWKIEERTRLKRIENEVRHEWNRERYLREAQEKRDKKKQATLLRKCATHQKKLLEMIKASEDFEKEERIKNRKRYQQMSNTGGRARGSSAPTEIARRVVFSMVKPSKQEWAYRSGAR